MLKQRIVSAVLLLVVGFAFGMPVAAQALDQTTITFDEPLLRTAYNGGFNGKRNYYLISSDGEFRVEAWQINGDGQDEEVDGEAGSENISQFLYLPV